MATELENLVPEADVEVEGMRGPKGDKGDSYILTEADKEEIAQKVDTIIDAETDKTLSISGKPADAKAAGDAIDDLKADLSEIVPGLSDAAKEALLACFEHVAWIDDDGQDYYDDLHDALYPPKSLVSISAVYSGGSVYIGTDTQTLKSNIVVTGHYDDSSTSVINSYTLTGSISTVGNNTLTITSSGLTTTIIVTGIIDASYRLITPDRFAQSGDTTTTKFGDTDFPMTYSSYKVVFQCIMAPMTGHSIVVLWKIGDSVFGYNSSGWFKSGGVPTAEEQFVLDTENVSTVTVSRINPNKFVTGGTLKIGDSNTSFNASITIYSYKIYGVDSQGNETLLVDVRPTSTVGQLEDRVAGTTIQAWQDTTGFSVEEV